MGKAGEQVATYGAPWATAISAMFFFQVDWPMLFLPAGEVVVEAP